MDTIDPARQPAAGTGVPSAGVTLSREAVPSGAHRLAARLYAPHAAPSRAIVIHPATGVPQGYYEALARWLAERRRAAVLTYDYRDFGDSARGHPRDSDATMADWGVRDQSAALDWLCERYPALPIEVVGHSLGGQYLSFHARAARVQRLVTVASGPAHWTEHPARFMPSVLWFWFLAGPLVTRVAGYLPGRLLGLGADLPAGVYQQWRRWCLATDFNRRDWGTLLPEPDLDAFVGEAVLVGISDDEFIPPARARLNAASYPAARVGHVEVRPSDLGLSRIGHVKLMSARCAAAWPALFDPRPSTD